MAQVRNKLNKGSLDQIIKVFDHKTVYGHKLFLVEWKMRKQYSWEALQKIPKKVYETYEKLKQNSFEVPQQKSLKLRSSSKKQTQISTQKPQQPQKLTKKILRRRKNNIEAEDEKDSFMDQPEEKQQRKQAQISEQEDNQCEVESNSRLQIKSSANISDLGKEIELVADIQSSSSESNEDQEDSESKNHIYRLKRMKQPKMKVTNSKMIRKHKRKYFDEDNILDKRNRTTQRKNYKELKDIKLAHTKSKMNFQNFLRDFSKLSHIQSSLVSTVLESGMNGPYKYYLVKLKNRQNVYIRERDMRRFFPRKLQQFFERVVNKIGKSTRQLNFIL